MPTEPALVPRWRAARRFGWAMFALGGIGFLLCVGAAIRALSRMRGGPIGGNDLERLDANIAIGFVWVGLALFGVFVLFVRRVMTASRPSLAGRVGLLAGGGLIFAAAPGALHGVLRSFAAIGGEAIEPTTARIVSEQIGASMNCTAFGLLVGTVLGVVDSGPSSPPWSRWVRTSREWQ